MAATRNLSEVAVMTPSVQHALGSGSLTAIAPAALLCSGVSLADSGKPVDIDALQIPGTINRDLCSGGGLFTGGYRDYVYQVQAGDLRLFARALQQSRSTAMERPQLSQSGRALQLSFRRFSLPESRDRLPGRRQA